MSLGAVAVQDTEGLANYALDVARGAVQGAERGAQRLQLRNYLHGHTLGSHRRHSLFDRGTA